jgi:hypothetical protein
MKSFGGDRVTIYNDSYFKNTVNFRPKEDSDTIYTQNLIINNVKWLSVSENQALSCWVRHGILWGRLLLSYLAAFSVSRGFGDLMSLEDGVYGAAADSQALGRQFLIPAAFVQNVQ